jgi:hypothetical protein
MNCSSALSTSPPVLCPVRSPCRTRSRLLPSVLGSRPSSRRLRTLRRRSPRPGRLSPPRGGVQGHLFGADGYNCPLARAIFVFIIVFPDRGLATRPHRLFDLQRHGRRRTSPLGGCSAPRPPAGKYRPRLLLHQLRQLA